MSDETGTKEEAAKTEAAPAAAAPKADHHTRLQALEVEARSLLDAVKLDIINTETGLSKELEAAELRLQQFVHNLSTHLKNHQDPGSKKP